MINTLKALNEIAGRFELFMFEAPCNNYQPAPPIGWFAMRSNKRRIFLQLVNGTMLNGDEVQRRIRVREFTEHPLA